MLGIRAPRRASCRPGSLHAGAGGRALRARARGVPRRRLPARPDRALALAGAGGAVRGLSVPEAVTWLCHTWLGVSLGLAPVGAWVAMTGELPWQAWALGGARRALGWRASISSTRSSTSSTTASRGCTPGRCASASAACSSALACITSASSPCSHAAGLGLDVGVAYWLGVAAVAALLAYEHSLVRPGDLDASTPRSSPSTASSASSSSASSCSTSPHDLRPGAREALRQAARAAAGKRSFGSGGSRLPSAL